MQSSEPWVKDRGQRANKFLGVPELLLNNNNDDDTNDPGNTNAETP